MGAERFARVHIRQMYLDERYGDRQQCVPQGHTGVGERRRVEDDKFDLLLSSLVDMLQQYMLGIALLEA
mgnify:CR=1 FL=1